MEKMKRKKQEFVIWLGIFMAIILWAVLIPLEARAAETDTKETQSVEDSTEAGDTEADVSAVNTTGNTGSFLLSTDYPGMTMKPGETTSFSLYFINQGQTETDVTLSVKDLPEGWEGYFRGSSNQVSMIHISADQTKDNSPTLSYSLTLPEDAAEGSYTVTLCAEDTAGNRTELPLAVTVAVQEAGAGNFTAEYPEQQGASGTSFSFATTLVNNGAASQSYSLSANAPEGWQVTFTPSGESSQVASLPVDAGNSQGITVAVTPADNVEKGDYTVGLVAASADETLKLDLKVTITGTYAVTLTTPTGNLSMSAYANEETPITMSIQNNGNVALENLQLSASASTDWNVRFDETTIDSIEAGATKEITAYVQPSKDAVIGDYVTAVTVSNTQTSSEMDLRVSVKNHTTWGFVAVAIIVILCAGLGIVIRRYGRR